MAGFLARWYAPRIQQLEAELEAAKERSDELSDEKETWKRLYVAEITANRTREDLLLNAALGAAGASTVLTREALARPPVDESPAEMDETDQAILRQRATEIAQQRSNTDEVSEEQVEQVLKELLKNPHYWLTDN